MANGNLAIPGTGHMSGLAVVLAALLEEGAGLPEPSSVTIYGVLQGHVHDELSLQFPGVPDSQEALVLWAQRFGGVITAKTVDRDTGPELWVDVTFRYRDAVDVEAFALIPLPALEAIPDAEQDSEPIAATPF